MGTLKCKKMIKLASNSGADKNSNNRCKESYHKSSKSYHVFKDKDFSLSQIKKLNEFSKKLGVIFFNSRRHCKFK